MTLDKSALYITFNYTNTLERIYNIDNDNIFHIHGNLDLVDYRNILAWVIPSFSTIEEAEVAEQVQVNENNNDTVRKHVQFGSIGNNAETIKLEWKISMDMMILFSFNRTCNKLVLLDFVMLHQRI